MQQARKFDRCRCSHRCVQLRDHEILRWLQSKIESSNEKWNSIVENISKYKKTIGRLQSCCQIGFHRLCQGYQQAIFGSSRQENVDRYSCVHGCIQQREFMKSYISRYQFLRAIAESSSRHSQFQFKFIDTGIDI